MSLDLDLEVEDVSDLDLGYYECANVTVKSFDDLAAALKYLGLKESAQTKKSNVRIIASKEELRCLKILLPKLEWVRLEM